MSEEQQKLPNLLLHAIFRIDEIAVNGPNDRSLYRRDSRSSVSPRREIAPLSRIFSSLLRTLASLFATGAASAWQITTRHVREGLSC